MADYAPLVNVGTAGATMAFMLYLFNGMTKFMRDRDANWQAYDKAMRDESHKVLKEITQGFRNEMIHMGQVLDEVKVALIEHDTRMVVWLQQINPGTEEGKE